MLLKWKNETKKQLKVLNILGYLDIFESFQILDSVAILYIFENVDIFCQSRHSRDS